MSQTDTAPQFLHTAYDQDATSQFHFRVMALLGTLGVLCAIAFSFLFGPASKPMFHFSEDGAITALSSTILSITSALAFVVFYLRSNALNIDRLFWLLVCAGSLFLGLDEQLQFHERGGSFVETTEIGKSSLFRNWNDLVVIAYGVIGLGVAAVFRREVFRFRPFAVFVALGFFFYAVHTGIDALLPVSVAWKDAPEEGAKLLSVYCLLLGVLSQLMAMLGAIKRKVLPRDIMATDAQ